MKPTLRPRERAAIIQALSAGVVPNIGLQHIQVGRLDEIQSTLQVLDFIADGGAAFRLVIGDYGAGKTFFLALVRAMALERKLVVASADLSPDRRLHSSSGQARSLFAELMRNLATRSKPDGGALAGVVEKFISTAMAEAAAAGETPKSVILKKLQDLRELVNGFDFATVIAAYCQGHETGNGQLMSDALRWLRGEFTNKTDAYKALGVRTYVDDSDMFDQLKLMARFVRLAGFAGLLVSLDEMVNLYKLANSQTRNSNYEQILRILNDSLQGKNEGLGFVLGGTPEFLMDPRRGMYSYVALRSRLEENQFARNGLVDLSGPVINLGKLTSNELFVLFQKIRAVFEEDGASEHLITDKGIASFMEHCGKRIGEAQFRTPRTTIKSFLDVLAVLKQYPGTKLQDLLGATAVVPDTGAALEQSRGADQDDEFASFSM